MPFVGSFAFSGNPNMRRISVCCALPNSPRNMLAFRFMLPLALLVDWWPSRQVKLAGIFAKVCQEAKSLILPFPDIFPLSHGRRRCMCMARAPSLCDATQSLHVHDQWHVCSYDTPPLPPNDIATPPSTLSTFRGKEKSCPSKSHM